MEKKSQKQCLINYSFVDKNVFFWFRFVLLQAQPNLTHSDWHTNEEYTERFFSDTVVGLSRKRSANACDC